MSKCQLGHVDRGGGGAQSGPLRQWSHTRVATRRIGNAVGENACLGGKVDIDRSLPTNPARNRTRIRARGGVYWCF